MSSLPMPLLVAAFLAAAAAVWVAGGKVSETTDILADRLHLGQALGGLVVLAVVTNLPELAIVCSGAARGQLSIATGNILGGIAAQTVVLALLDRATSAKRRPLTYRVGSVTPVLEGLLVVAVLGLVVIGTQMPNDQVWARTTPVALLIAAVWLVGVKVVAGAGSGGGWQLAPAPVDSSAPDRRATKAAAAEKAEARHSTARVGAVFGFGALATLIAGVVLEQASDAIASDIGMSGVIFGATVLAAATSLPELSTGITSIRLGQEQMAFGDIFGGNAFLPALFAVAVAISGQAVLPTAGSVNLYLTAGGIVLTTIYLFGLILRPTRLVAGMGIDSLAVLVAYVALVGGLAVI